MKKKLQDVAIKARDVRDALFKFIYLAFALTLSQRLWAGPPFITDDPEPVEYEHHELYIATQQIRTADGITGTLPHVEFNYGVVPDMQLHVLAPMAFSNPTHGSYEHGYGDTELGIKYRLLQETEDTPMVGIFPLAEMPTGDVDKNLGNGKAEYFLPLWIQKKWDSWQSYGGGGYWINKEPGQKNHWFWGWQLQKEFSAHLTLGAEVFYQTELVASQGHSSGFNVGGYYNFDEQNHLLFSIGRGLTNVSLVDRETLYLAYQWTW